MAHGCVVSEHHTRADMGGQTPGSWGKCLVDLVVVIASDTEPTEKFKQKWEFLGKVKEGDSPRNCNYFQVLPYAHLFGCVYICVSVCLSDSCEKKAVHSRVQDVSQIGHRSPWEARNKHEVVGIGGSKGYK